MLLLLTLLLKKRGSGQSTKSYLIQHEDSHLFCNEISLICFLFFKCTNYHAVSRPSWEYFGTGMANHTPGAYQACERVQFKITTNPGGALSTYTYGELSPIFLGQNIFFSICRFINLQLNLQTNLLIRTKITSERNENKIRIRYCETWGLS